MQLFLGVLRRCAVPKKASRARPVTEGFCRDHGEGSIRGRPVGFRIQTLAGPGGSKVSLHLVGFRACWLRVCGGFDPWPGRSVWRCETEHVNSLCRCVAGDPSRKAAMLRSKRAGVLGFSPKQTSRAPRCVRQKEEGDRARADLLWQKQPLFLNGALFEGTGKSSCSVKPRQGGRRVEGCWYPGQN